MKPSGETPSKTTLWRRRRAAAAQAVVVRHEDRDAFIDRKARDLGLGGRDWPLPRGEHKRLSMGDGASRAGDRAIGEATLEPCGTAIEARSSMCEKDNASGPVQAVQSDPAIGNCCHAE